MRIFLLFIAGLVGAVAGYFVLVAFNAVTLMLGGNGLSSGPETLAIVAIFMGIGFFGAVSLAPKLLDSVRNRANSIKSGRVISEAKYREALQLAEKEVDEERQDSGIWAEALIKAKGNEAQRKIEYMQLRAKSLCSFNAEHDSASDCKT